jgi:hypothetical protein
MALDFLDIEKKKKKRKAQVSSLIKIRPVAVALLHANGQTLRS